MDWKVLGKVLFRVFSTIAVAAGLCFALIFAIVFLGPWSLLIFPLILLFVVVKMLYHDELIRQGKGYKR